MRKGLLKILLAGVVIAFGSMLATNARAAGVKTSFPILASLDCDGTISGSADKTDIPDGNFAMLGAWVGAAKTDVAPTTTKAGGPVVAVMGMYIDAACASLDANGFAGPNQNPCGQILYGTGSYAVTSTGTAPSKAGTVSLTFSESPALNGEAPPPPNSDVFDNCTANFNVNVFSSSIKGKRSGNTGSFMTLSGAITGGCKAVNNNTKIIMSCTSRNN